VNVSIISVRSYVGGIAGHVGDSGVIENCYSTGVVSGNNYVGGIVGRSSNSNVTNCYSTGNVSSDGYVGGIAGWVQNTNVMNCYSTGALSGNGGGGIAGCFLGSGITIMYCAALNVSVAGNGNKRIISSLIGSLSLLGNIAWNNMLVNGATVTGSASDENGTNTSAAAIRNGTAFVNMFTDSVWTKQTGYLPGLFGKPVPIPAHIN